VTVPGPACPVGLAANLSIAAMTAAGLVALMSYLIPTDWAKPNWAMVKPKKKMVERINLFIIDISLT
jgi:hypothetical protein